ncbi:hypothetical protein TSACC_21460 [Terrimicrobium sacchariphilum]|uniref:Uncharacterized protein n=2 Tax=Terrimicrobium sacchariphilum TaxID=690879 RepID=A0A146G5M6_TERSA|nr:hypothetical protein TSACC_21460 [Terrimicrobium sacchariphilum]
MAGVLLIVTGAQAGELVASFKEDFQDETPKKGWQYQWNADTVDDTATYANLSYQSEKHAYVTDPYAGGEGAPAGPYIKRDFAHPGAESSSGGKNCIYTYTLQAGQGGKISITDSTIIRVDQANPGDIEVRIRVNDTVGDPVSIETKGSFDRELGTLKDGDVISVLVGPGASANFDMYRVDFSLIKE